MGHRITRPQVFLTSARGRRLQQPAAGFDKDFCAGDDVGIISVLGPVMADAADRRHEQHACRHDAGENFSYFIDQAFDHLFQLMKIRAFINHDATTVFVKIEYTEG